MPYSTAELDTIRLCVVLEAINGIANHAMLDVPRIIEPGTETEVRYKSRQHQHLFLIRLLDFAKENGDEAIKTSGSLRSQLSGSSDKVALEKLVSMR